MCGYQNVIDLVLNVCPVPTIQQTAAVALGRLADASEDLAAAVVSADILPQLVGLTTHCHINHFTSFVTINLNNRTGLLIGPAKPLLQESRCLCAANCGQALARACQGLRFPFIYCNVFDPSFQAVVDSGALDALVTCLEEFDPSVKEAAAWALGYIARHNAGSSRQ